MHFFREHISNVFAFTESQNRQVTFMNFFFCKPIPEELLKAIYSSLLQITSIISENCCKGFTAIFPFQQKPVPSDPIPTKSPHLSFNWYQRIFFFQC